MPGSITNAVVLKRLLYLKRKHQLLEKRFQAYQRTHPNWNQTYANRTTAIADAETKLRRLIQQISERYNLNINRRGNLNTTFANTVHKFILHTMTSPNLARSRRNIAAPRRTPH